MEKPSAHKMKACTQALCVILPAALTQNALADPLSLGSDAAAHVMPVEISDARLAGYRGRFVSSGIVSYFGVEMVSQWSGPDGAAATVGMRVDIPVNNARGDSGSAGERRMTVRQALSYRDPREALPQDPGLAVTGGTGRSEPKSAFAPQGASVPSNGQPPSTRVLRVEDASDTRGVMQRIHVSGDGNSVENRAGIDITLTTDDVAAVSGDPTRDVTGYPGEVVVNGPQPTRVVTEQGTVLQTEVETGRMGVSIQVPGQARVEQRIAGRADAQKRGVLQAVLLSGDLQHVRNNLEFQAVIAQTPAFTGARQLTPALKSLMQLQLNR